MKKLMTTFVLLAACAALTVPAFALSKGDSGDDVVRLQQALIEQGYLTGDADGQYGPLTEAAVKTFREANGLPSEGGADDEMMAILYGETMEPETEPAEDLSEVIGMEEAAEPQTYSLMVQKYETGEIRPDELRTWLQENYLYKAELLVKAGIEAINSEEKRAEVDIEYLPGELTEESLINEDGRYYVSLETLTRLAYARLNIPVEDYNVTDNRQLSLAAAALSADDSEKAALDLLAFFIDGTTGNEAAMEGISDGDVKENVEEISDGNVEKKTETISDGDIKKKAVMLCMIADAATRYMLSSEQIMMLSGAGIITGIRDYTIEKDTDVVLSDLIAANTGIVKNIKVDDSEVLYDIDGSYIAYCHIILDIAALKAYEAENDVDFMLPDENLDFVADIVVTIESEETVGTAKMENMTVITKDNKNDVIAQITSQVTENVTTVTELMKKQETAQADETTTGRAIDRVNMTTNPAQETAAPQREITKATTNIQEKITAAQRETTTTSKQNQRETPATAKETTAVQKETTAQRETTTEQKETTTAREETTTGQKETQPQTQKQTEPETQGQTEHETQHQPETPTETPTTAHIHSYEVVENVAATCESDGYTLYRCTGCGDSYTETLYATGHNWVEVSQGWVVNRVTKVECRWCGALFDTEAEWGIHSDLTDHGNYTWTDVEVSREPVSDDLAQTWTYVGDQCSICGAWR